MKLKHTPGPWKTIPSPHGRKYRCVQFGADDSYTSLEMLPADARLVAAAPDLLQLVLEFENWKSWLDLEGHDEGSRQELDELYDRARVFRKQFSADGRSND